MGKRKIINKYTGALLFLAGLGFILFWPFSNRPFDYPRNLKIIHTTLGEDPKTLDPAEAGDAYSVALSGNVYGYPIEYHFLKRPVRMRPGMARDLGQFGNHPGQGPAGKPRPDLKGKPTFTISLKPGLKFARDICLDPEKAKPVSREITANDFALAIKRQANPFGEPRGAFLIEGIIHGFSDYRTLLQENPRSDSSGSDGTSAAETESGAPANKKKVSRPDYELPLSGLEILDRYTIRLTLTKDTRMIRYFFTNIFSTPVPGECVNYYDGSAPERPQFRRHPVGSGPFLLEKWHEGHSLLFARNPDYRDDFYPTDGLAPDQDPELLKSAGKKLPLVDKVEVRIVKQSITDWLLFKQGYRDLAGIPKDVFSQVISLNKLDDDLKSRGIKLTIAPDNTTFYFTFNMDDKVVGGLNPKAAALRQALSLAVDREDYIQKFLNGRGKVAHSPIPPGIPGYDANYKNPFIKPDLKKARALLEKAGYPDGIVPATGKPLEIRLLLVAGPSNHEIVNYFYLTFKKLGIELKGELADWSTVMSKTHKGRFQMTLGGWGADYPEAENFMQLLYSPNIEGAGTNNARYRRPAFDQLYLKLYGATTQTEQKELVRQMNQFLEKDTPWLYLFHRTNFTLVHGWYQNQVDHPFPQGAWRFRDVDTRERETYREKYNRPARWPLVLVYLLMAWGVFATVRDREEKR